MAAKNTTKLNKAMLKKGYELALKGFSHKQICESVGIGKSSLYSARYAELLETIKKGEHELREDITSTILATLENDNSMKIFLSKRLNLFHTGYSLPKLTSIEQAASEISNLNIALSDGDIPIELHSSLLKGINEFVKSKEIGDLETRIKKLEESNGK